MIKLSLSSKETKANNTARRPQPITKFLPKSILCDGYMVNNNNAVENSCTGQFFISSCEIFVFSVHMLVRFNVLLEGKGPKYYKQILAWEYWVIQNSSGHCDTHIFLWQESRFCLVKRIFIQLSLCHLSWHASIFWVVGIYILISVTWNTECRSDYYTCAACPRSLVKIL